MCAVLVNRFYLNTGGFLPGLENTQAVCESHCCVSLPNHAILGMKDFGKVKLRLTGQMDVEDPARAKKTFVLLVLSRLWRE